jgi:hypothetical protein
MFEIRYPALMLINLSNGHGQTLAYVLNAHGHPSKYGNQSGQQRGNDPMLARSFDHRCPLK